MNFALSDDHILLRDSAQAFVDGESRLDALLVPGATVAAAPYAENWSQIRELGWPGLIVPEAYGGAGLDCIELSLIVTELGRTLMPSPFAGHTFGTWALLAAGGAQQQERWLPEAGTGSSLRPKPYRAAESKCVTRACMASTSSSSTLPPPTS